MKAKYAIVFGLSSDQKFDSLLVATREAHKQLASGVNVSVVEVIAEPRLINIYEDLTVEEK